MSGPLSSPPLPKSDRARVCPQCISPVSEGVRETALVGVDPLVHCEKCGWRGNQSDLILIRTAGSGANEQEMTQAFIGEMALAIGNAIYRPLRSKLIEILLPTGVSKDEEERAVALIDRLTSAGISAAFKGVLEAMVEIEQCQKKNTTLGYPSPTESNPSGSPDAG